MSWEFEVGDLDDIIRPTCEDEYQLTKEIIRKRKKSESGRSSYGGERSWQVEGVQRSGVVGVLQIKKEGGL